MGASDIMLKNQQPPTINIDGNWKRMEKYQKLTDSDIHQAMYSCHPNKKEEDVKAQLMATGALNYRTSVEDHAFRISVGLQSGNPYIVARPIPRTIPSLDELNMLPPRPSTSGRLVNPVDTLRDLALRKKGIVIVTGQTGSGKSTTLAAMINHINVTRQTHIITIEDPIEFIHRDRQSFFNQREVGPHDDVPSFEHGVEQAMRQAPGVILIGEIRNRATMQAALQAAETGHMVFCTLHTRDVPSTLQRVFSMFPGPDRDQIAVQFASTVVAVISQQLVPKAHPHTGGRGRQLVAEILVANDAVRVNLRKNDKNLETMLRDAGNRESDAGNLQMDRELARAVHLGLISEDAARLFAVQDNFEKTLTEVKGGTL
ncbi:twitching motility protein PilT [Deinococcus ruber]|uniref:Twitching motility protein PilT n=1 Tax=Deinococcus ruber TaxID=1848197 RepID=A0A918C746_9DEIO|nr:twitching motility protein PilT [Deinococcus ruber]